MLNLPYHLAEPLYWWAVKAPRKIHTLCRRLIRISNNELGFGLNLRLLFVPLFNDYTKAGRIIGFIIRVVQFIFGGVFLLILVLLSLLLPILWWLAPFIITYYWALWIIPITLFVLGAHVLFICKFPRKRVTEVTEANLELAFRKEALHFLNLFRRDNVTAFVPLFSQPQIKYLLQKAELPDMVLLEKVTTNVYLNIAGLADKALDYARNHDCRYVELEHVFVASLSCIDSIDNMLTTLNSSLTICEDAARWIVSDREALAKIYFWQDDYEVPLMGGIGRGMTNRVTPFLDSISEDYTKMAQKGYLKKVVGHSAVVEEVANILSGSKDDVLIIGPPGSGKTSIVKGIAIRVIKGTKYKSLQNKRIIKIDAGSLIAGANNPGQVAEVVKKMMDEITGSNDIILFIDEIHELVASFSGESAEVASMYSILEPYIASEGIKIVGATNLENYRKYIEPHGAFARLFHIVEIPQTPREETVEILRLLAKDIEKEQHVFITVPALYKILDLSDKLIHDRVHPDKGIDILNRSVASIVGKTNVVTTEVIAQTISKLTNVPVTSVSQDESHKLINIEAELKTRVIGQDHAIDEIGKALKRARMGIRNEKKPIASFMFIGTTGIGKTETAKALADIYFGDEDAMIRLDMSEYQQLDSMDRLIGAPDGSNKGVLTEAVRTSPFSLILLDELEKASYNVLLTFLQVLDDGRLSDATGKTYDFTNTIIIATSNVGTREIQEVASRGGDTEEMKTKALSKVKEHFAPEFLNRFNGLIVFNPLSMDNVRVIAQLILQRVVKMADSKGIKVSFKPELVEELARRGYSPEWGARPLARVVEEYVETYLAVKLLANELVRGDSVELGLEVFEEP